LSGAKVSVSVTTTSTGKVLPRLTCRRGCWSGRAVSETPATVKLSGGADGSFHGHDDGGGSGRRGRARNRARRGHAEAGRQSGRAKGVRRGAARCGEACTVRRARRAIGRASCGDRQRSGGDGKAVTDPPVPETRSGGVTHVDIHGELARRLRRAADGAGGGG